MIEDYVNVEEQTKKPSLVKQHLSNLIRGHTYNIFSNYHARGGALWGLAWGASISAFAYLTNTDIPQEAYFAFMAAGPALMIPAFGALGSIAKDTDQDYQLLESMLNQRIASEKTARKQTKRLEKLSRKPILDDLVKIYERSQGYKQGHSTKVINYCKRIANLRNLPLDEIRDLAQAAKLCDLGTLFVPPEIWNKRGKLSPAELRAVKRHPEYTVKFLKSLDIVSDYALRIISEHHESYDGSGYPLQKIGAHADLECSDDEQSRMCVAGEILATVDAYVSMTEPRPHRNTVMPPKQAMNILEKERGAQFDPTCVDQLITIVREELANDDTTKNFQTKRFRRPAPPIEGRPGARQASGTRNFKRSGLRNKPSRPFKPNTDLAGMPLGAPLKQKEDTDAAARRRPSTDLYYPLNQDGKLADDSDVSPTRSFRVRKD